MSITERAVVACPDMADWVKPEYSKGAVKRASRAIVRPTEISAADLAEARVVVNNWRSAHSYPLQVMNMLLR